MINNVMLLTKQSADDHQMTIRWLRILGAAIVAEIILLALLIGLVAIFGPINSVKTQDYTPYLRIWIGPLGGAFATFFLALWVARPLMADHMLHGGLLGLLVVLLDAGLLVATSASFQWLFVVSDLVWIVAGLLGGYVASRRSIRVA